MQSDKYRIPAENFVGHHRNPDDPWQLTRVALDCLNGTAVDSATRHLKLYVGTAGALVDFGSKFKCALFAEGSNCTDIDHVEKLEDLSCELPTADGYVSGGVELTNARLGLDGEDWVFKTDPARFFSVDAPTKATHAVVYFEQPGSGNVLLCTRALDTDDTRATTAGYELNVVKRSQLFNLGHFENEYGESYPAPCTRLSE